MLLGNQKARIAEVSEISSLMENQNSGLAEVQRFMDSLNQTPVLRLLTRIGLYAWVLIAAFVHCVGRRKSYESWMLLLLPMTVLIGCCFSPVNGYYRYACPMIVTTPLLASAAVMLPDRKATGAARK